MATTDRRVEELLDRWQASVELHLRYLKLDDAAYARAEAWPKHQRPNALVVNLARTRLLELKAHLSERRDAGDAKFAESLELMSFLTSLLGSEHIERFIPLATGKAPDTGTSGTVEQPRVRAAARTAAHQKSSGAAPMPSKATQASATQKSSTGSHKRSTRPRPAPATAAAPKPAARPGPAPASPPRPTDAMTRQVIADAIRMLQWGREWPALAGLIARMADRPSETEVWKILRAYRSDILATSRRTG
ncbi:MAG: hypothetical protein OEV90_12035 [Gammaproteobacteria bacterium]|nr:hypothetical protein [Gammaproteobacteria bacterium]